jgi:chromosome segregation ATPase
MLQKVRDALEARKIADELFVKLDQQEKKLDEHGTAVEKVTVAVSELTDSISTMKSYHEELIGSLQSTLQAAQAMKAELSSNVINLKVLKSQLQSQLMDKVGEELQQLTSQFQGKVDSISRLQEEMMLIAADVNKMREEINRFTTISAHIRNMDFELGNYAQKLRSGEEEKLQLMRQIDSLQRLVSKMRQRVQ